MRSALVAALLAAVALTGCGAAKTASSADKFSGARKDVAQTIDDLAANGRSGKAKETCDALLAAELKQRLLSEGKNCISTIKQAFDDADNFDLEVRSVTVAGTKATARVKSRQGTHDRIDSVPLVNERGAWKFVSFGG